MKTALVLIVLSVTFSLQAFAQEPIQLVAIPFELAKYNKEKVGCTLCEKKDGQLKSLTDVINDTKFIKETKPVAKVVEKRIDESGNEVEETIYLYPASEEARVMGLTAKEALLASRDDISTSPCSSWHKQGDLANRWCHTAIAMGVSYGAEKAGASKPVAGLAGTAFWLLKEKLVDLNASSGDLVYTYEDSLGTKRSKVSITIFADSVFDSHFKKIKLMKDSTPFISFTRKLGPAPK